MSKGYVYILSNISMPGMVKIGKTTRDVVCRANELFQTGVPTPFSVEHYVASPDCHVLEARVHSALDDARVSDCREFFCVDHVVARETLNECHEDQVNEWLDEFMPGHMASDGLMSLDHAHVETLSIQSGAYWSEVVSAINGLTADEIAPAIERCRARVAEMNAKAGRF